MNKYTVMFALKKHLNRMAAAGAAILLSVSVCHTGTAAQQPSGDRPNIIFVLTDDQAYHGFNTYGGESFGGKDFHTPFVDSLASTGMKFTNCHARPMCSPSRQVLMTGRTMNRVNIEGTWLPEIMQNAGYTTGISGKWMVGHTALQPIQRGFDEALIWAMTTDYWRPAILVFNSGGYMKEYNQPEGIEIEAHNFNVDTGGGPGNAKRFHGDYGPHIINNFARDFIERHANDPNPFYLFYPMKLPHVFYFRMPDGSPGSYSAYIDYIDKMIRQLVETVDKTGIREETMIVISSDNGYRFPKEGLTDPDDYIPGLKGGARSGATRVPFIVNWKGTVQPGTLCEDLIDWSDLLPTFVQAAGGDLPEDERHDGISFYPQLLGNKGYKRDWLYIHGGGHPNPLSKDQAAFYTKESLQGDDGYVIRFAQGDRYKLYGDGRFYDLQQDIAEENIIDMGTGTPEAEAKRKLLQSVLNMKGRDYIEKNLDDRADVDPMEYDEPPIRNIGAK